MKTKEFISKIDKCKITYYTWEVQNPKAIVHIVHGSIEYALRYDTFAKVLNANGYSVYAMDLRGHGETGKRTRFGYFGEKDGYRLVWDDVHTINNIIKKEHPKKKIVLIGHSMGSFITRSYITQYHDTDMLIAIGSAQKSRIENKFNQFLIKFNLMSKNKAKKPGKFFYRMLYLKLAKPFKEENDPLSWLSKEVKNREAYKNSEYTGFMMTNRGFYDMSIWMDVLTDKKQIKNISQDYPILLLNGAEDPVGSMGKEIHLAHHWHKKHGLNSKHIEYKNMRHEILNEKDRKIVEKDILQFIQKHI